MIEPTILQEYKEAWGQIFSTTVGKVDYLFRPITTAEFEQMQDAVDDDEGSSVDMEDAVVRLAVVYPVGVDFDKIKPGYVTALAEEIMQFSGFTDGDIIKQLLLQYRDVAASDARVTMKAFILATMPTYTEDVLDGFHIYELIEKVVLAEEIIKINIAMLGMDPNDAPRFEIGPAEEQAEPQTKTMRGSLLDGLDQPYIPDPTDNKKVMVEDEGLIDAKKTLKTLSEDVDPRTKERLTGQAADDDPIAAKLRQAMR